MVDHGVAILVDDEDVPLAGNLLQQLLLLLLFPFNNAGTGAQSAEVAGPDRHLHLSLRLDPG